MDGESDIIMISLIKVWILIITSLIYSYFIVSKIPKGKIRLITLLPVFSIYLLLPLSLSSSSIYFTTMISFSISWIADFKLLLFAFNQGPLSVSSSNQSISFFKFISIASLPIRIKQNPPPQITKNSTSNRSNLNLAAQVLVFALLIPIYDFNQQINPNIIVVLYCLHVYLFDEISMAICYVLVRILFRIELEPVFDEPYLSTSLQDFWGSRWNLVATSILRSTVYVPIRRISTPFFGRKCVPLPALLATFLVSGLMHELIYFYATRVGPTWEVTWFFVIHGICTAIEIAVKRGLNGRCRWHPVISRLLVLGFVIVTGFWLFFPQLLRNGVDVKLITEYQSLMEFVKHSIVTLKALNLNGAL